MGVSDETIEVWKMLLDEKDRMIKRLENENNFVRELINNLVGKQLVGNVLRYTLNIVSIYFFCLNTISTSPPMAPKVRMRVFMPRFLVPASISQIIFLPDPS